MFDEIAGSFPDEAEQLRYHTLANGLDFKFTNILIPTPALAIFHDEMDRTLNSRLAEADPI